MFKFIKKITKVLHWCKLFKSKTSDIGSPAVGSPEIHGPYDKTNVTKKRSVSINDFLLKLISGRFKKALSDQVVPILEKVALETDNKIDDAAVQLLKEILKSCDET